MNRQVKKKLAEIQAIMGYVTVQTGPRCDACNHSEAVNGLGLRQTWLCKLGGFATVATSRCSKFEPIKIGKP